MGVNYNARIVSDGLLACWDAGNNLSLSNINRNILTSPEDFSSGFWVRQTTTVLINQAIAPDGTMTADKIIGDNGVTGRKSIYQPYQTFIAGTTYTYSVYIKSAGFTNAMIWFDTANATQGAFFGAGSLINLTTGVAPGGQTVVTDAGNGWYRCSITFTATVAGGYNLQLSLGDANGSGTAVGDGVAGVFVWGAHLEEGNSATVYYPVSSSGLSTTWFDISGRNNNCTLASGITLRNNNNIRSLYFSGAQRSRIPTDTFNVLYSGKTMFVIAKIDSNFGVSGTFRGFLGGGGGTRNFNLYLNRNGSLYRFHFSQGVNYSFPGGFSSDLTGLALDQWFVGAVTQTSAGLVTYYFNGSPVGTHTTALLQFVPHTEFDYLGGNDTNYLGDIAFCAAYSRALSSDEILQMYNALRGRYRL